MLLVLALQYAKSGRAKCKAGKQCQDVIPQVCFAQACSRCSEGQPRGAELIAEHLCDAGRAAHGNDG